MRYIEACENQEWSIGLWDAATGADPRAVPYTCRSWRHAGACREWCGACDFARVLQAISEHANWTYLILTYPHREWPDVSKLFKFGVVSWSRLRKRLNREFGKILYIQTWEVHRSMYPHVNVVVSNDDLHARASKDFFQLKSEVLEPMAEDCGFGFVKWCEPLIDQARMAGYITKLGLELTGSHHKNQTPVNAPKHFRRIRASRGLLPKRAKDDTITGQLFKLSSPQLDEAMSNVLAARIRDRCLSKNPSEGETNECTIGSAK